MLHHQHKIDPDFINCLQAWYEQTGRLCQTLVVVFQIGFKGRGPGRTGLEEVARKPPKASFVWRAVADENGILGDITNICYRNNIL
jgi:hypothetical protein